MPYNYPDAMSVESVQWTSHSEPSQCESQPIWDRRANLWLLRPEFSNKVHLIGKETMIWKL
jgi:hypothetical protein